MASHILYVVWSVWDEASEFCMLVRSGWSHEFVEHWFRGNWQLEDPVWDPIMWSCTAIIRCHRYVNPQVI